MSTRLDDAGELFDCLLAASAPNPSDAAVLIQSYVDESYDNGIMCLAGFLFRSTEARKFDDAWRRMLVRHGLPFFHMSACNSGKYPFEAMDLPSRVAAQTDAIRIIGEHAELGFSISVEIPAFRKVVRELNLYKTAHDLFATPYQLALSFTVQAVTHWMHEREPPECSATYFFEAGHQHQGQANQMMQRIYRDKEARRYNRYRSHQFVDKVAVRATQAADIFAWQSFKNIQRRAKGIEKPRADFTALMEGTPTKFLHVDEETIRMLGTGIIRDWIAHDETVRFGLALREPSMVALPGWGDWIPNRPGMIRDPGVFGLPGPLGPKRDA